MFYSIENRHTEKHAPNYLNLHQSGKILYNVLTSGGSIMSAIMIVKDGRIEGVYSPPGSPDPKGESPYKPDEHKESPDGKVMQSTSAVATKTFSSSLEGYLLAAGSQRMALEKRHAFSFAEGLYLGTRPVHRDEAMKDVFLISL